MSAHRVDVHTHLVPPFWAKDLPKHGGAEGLSSERLSEINNSARALFGRLTG